MRETESSTLRAKDEVFCNVQIYNNQQIELEWNYVQDIVEHAKYTSVCIIRWH